MREVVVAGIGEIPFGAYLDSSLREMIRISGTKAIEDASIPVSEIDALMMSNFNAAFLSGQSHIGALASEELGLGARPTIRFENACASGGVAFRTAYMLVAGGHYDTVLVGGVEKMCHRETQAVTEALASASDQQHEAGIGATFPSLFALIAQRYMYEFKTPRQHMALVAVQNHDHGLLNPDAQMKKKITLEKVLSAAPIAHPFTLYDCSLISDGAVFLLLTTAEKAKNWNQSRNNPTVIGSGQAGDSLSITGKKSITTFSATVKAAHQAYEMSGLSAKDIDFAEVHDCFTITQIINTEDLGFFPKGWGGYALEEGATRLDGAIPINPSGGLKSKGHPIGATGLSQIYEVVLQLRGEAGERQLRKAEIGLAHNLGGTAATCCVHILKRGQ